MAKTRNKKTIGLVITQGKWGGAQRYVFDLATHLATRYRVVVSIGTQHGSQTLQNRLHDFVQSHPTVDITVTLLNHLQRAITPWHALRAITELRQWVATNHIDLVHYNSSKAVVIGAHASRGTIPQIATIHGWPSQELLSPMRSWLYRLLEKRASRALDALITIDLTSSRIAQDKYGLPKKKVHHIAHRIAPIDFLPRDDAREQFEQLTGQSLSNKYCVGTIANHYPTKRLSLFIDGLAQFITQKKDIVGLIIGDGPQRHALQQQINTLNMQDHIFLLGHQDNAARLLKGFDLFALSSAKEGYPYVLLEAQQAELPIVSTAVGGCIDILQNSPTGFLVDTPIPEVFAHTLAQARVQHTYPTKTLNTPPQQALDSMIEQTTTLYESFVAS